MKKGLIITTVIIVIIVFFIYMYKKHKDNAKKLKENAHNDIAANTTINEPANTVAENVMATYEQQFN
jgi:uncharacterized protein YpmB